MRLLLLATVTFLMLTFALSAPAWAGGRHGGHHDRCRPRAAPDDPPSADANGDGRLSTYERIQAERQERWNRLQEAQRGNRGS